LRAEAEKGFARTAFGRELTDPKSEINFEKVDDRRISRKREPSERVPVDEREAG